MDTSGTLFSDRYPWLWIFVVAGALLYIPFIGGVHLFDWDEINFAEISREMITTGDYLRVQVDYKPFFEKPPLFFWIQSLSMHVFGINEFAARLPNALCGIVVLVFLFKLGSHWVDNKFGVLWALSYMGSLLATLYHKSGIIDPWFNLFIFAAIASWVEGWQKSNAKWFLLSGMLSGLAVLTKGPVAPLLIGMTVLVMSIASRGSRFISVKSVLLFIAGCAGVAGIWFGVEWLAHGPDFLVAFLKYQVELLSKSVAGHKGFPGYHFVIALLGIFPASIFAIAAFRKKLFVENQQTWNMRLLMIILTLVVLIIFSLVKSKIVHYSSLAYYPLSFLSAWTLYNLLQQNLAWKKLHSVIGIAVALIVLLLLFTLPYVGMNLETIKEKIQLDSFTAASLEAEVVWDVFDFFPGVFFLAVIATSYFLYRKHKNQFAIVILFAGTAFLLNIFLLFFIGKIEHYSQRAAIEFYKSKENQQVEIETMGFHSYAPFFYARKPLMVSSVVKQQFVVLKKDKEGLLEGNKELKVMYEKNGFIFTATSANAQ